MDASLDFAKKNDCVLAMTMNGSRAACPLCRRGDPADLYAARGRNYYSCPGCGGAFLDPRDRLGPEEEKSRYLLHRNDVRDPGYRRFASPLVEAIAARQGTGDRGLDFGAGPGPVASTMLEERGFRTRLYDPYFRDDPGALEASYEFIICSEVMEHFYDPAEEFALLRRLLAPGGRLYCMTELLRDGDGFARWHYKEDPTHVFFYAERTIRWIEENRGFARAEANGRLIVFEG